MSKKPVLDGEKRDEIANAARYLTHGVGSTILHEDSATYL